MILQTNYVKIENDLYDVLNLFFPEEIKGNDNIKIFHKMEQKLNLVNNYFSFAKGDIFIDSTSTDNLPEQMNDIIQKRLLKRFAKLSLYLLLEKVTNKTLPWGCLTGIRPTKIAYELIENGVANYLVKENLMQKFYVSEDKAKLVEHTIRNQKCIIHNDNLIDLYINIPFCPTRCSYCSFISCEYDKVKNKMNEYISALIKELNATKQLIKDKAFIVRTIYIGGGTPTVLSANELEQILSVINYPVSEFTVECGRPDTITKEKLDILKKYGVTRISINPQTFVDATLKRIGRRHTVRDVIDAYKLALPYEFNINMDLIAGLPGETMRGFKKSISTCLELSPDNITVHTLAIKNGSNLMNQGEQIEKTGITEQMVIYARNQLENAGYQPYYLYKLKNQSSGQENVGYFKENVCIFNIDSIEESCSILACGANAISKRVFNFEKRIERFANVKDFLNYTSRIDEMIQKKIELFK